MAVSNPERRAAESALKPVAAAIPLAVEWMNEGFDRSLYAEYVRFGFFVADRTVMTTGQNPRVQSNGLIRLGVNVREGIGPDRMDALIGRQAAGADFNAGTGLLKAYPYPAVLSRDGYSIQLGIAKPSGAPLNVDGWWYQSVEIPWTQWRST